jgi:hypothetical protein
MSNYPEIDAKVARAKADLDEVYAAGLEAGKAQGAPTGAIEITENGTHDVSAYASAEVNVAASGGGDALADFFQRSGTSEDYTYAFYNCPASVFFPKQNIVVAYGNSMFAYFNSGRSEPVDLAARFEECGVSLDTSNAGNLGSLFKKANVSTTPPFTANSNMSSTFTNCTALHTIGKIHVPNQYISLYNIWYGCSALVNISFGGVIGTDVDFKHSTLLSTASIENIIEHLSDSVTGKTLTFSKTAVDNAFATSNNAEGSTTQEWAMLVSTKSKWTISLV